MSPENIQISSRAVATEINEENARTKVAFFFCKGVATAGVDILNNNTDHLDLVDHCHVELALRRHHLDRAAHFLAAGKNYLLLARKEVAGDAALSQLLLHFPRQQTQRTYDE